MRWSVHPRRACVWRALQEALYDEVATVFKSACGNGAHEGDEGDRDLLTLRKSHGLRSGHDGPAPISLRLRRERNAVTATLPGGLVMTATIREYAPGNRDGRGFSSRREASDAKQSLECWR